MIMKTEHLEGAALDWAVAKAICQSLMLIEGDWADLLGYMRNGYDEPQHWSPSIYWDIGGPLIERYAVEMRIVVRGREISASAFDGQKGYGFCRGGTHLIAAMRAIVAAELGKEVDVPDTLL